MKFGYRKIIAGLLFITGIALSSCINTDYTGQTAYGDAFIKSVQLNDSVIGYDLQLYAYSWSEMKSVEAYTESDQATKISLDTIDYKYTFAYQPEVENYSEEPPAENNYFFKVVFDDDEQTIVTDYLSSNSILPPTVDTLEWDDIDKQIKLEWNPVENAQIYSVALISPEGKVAFETDMLDNTVTSVWINQYAYGWHSGLKPEQTTNYQIVIRAFLFEPVASTFDIQCMAVNDTHFITWNLD